MKSDYPKILDLLNRRLELVRELIAVCDRWRRAFIGLHLDQSERCAVEEERLAAQICALDMEIATLEVEPSLGKQANPIPTEAGFGEPTAIDHSGPEIREALERMSALQMELKQSNEIRKSILKRSKITIGALRNLFNSHSATYAAPAEHSTGTIYEELV
jgi:hypothetical protein